MRVEGLLIFYISEREITIDGTTYSYWQMDGQKDLTGGMLKENETIHWSDVKALFWTAE